MAFGPNQTSPDDRAPAQGDSSIWPTPDEAAPGDAAPDEPERDPTHRPAIAWACWAAGAPLGLHRAYLGRFGFAPLVGAAAAGGLVAGAIVRPSVRGYLLGAGAAVALATWLREGIVLRGLLNGPAARADESLGARTLGHERGAVTPAPGASTVTPTPDQAPATSTDRNRYTA